MWRSEPGTASQLMVPTGRNLTGFVLSLNAAVLWGLLPIALKEIIQTMDAPTLVWYRFLVAAVVLFVYLWSRRQLPDLTSAKRISLYLLVIAGLGLCGNYVFFAMSLNFLNAESSEALIQLTSLFLLLGGVVFYREPFFAAQKFGSLLILIGLVLFFNDRYAELLNGGSQLTIGIFLAVLGAITWVVYALLQKFLLRSFSSVQILLIIYFLSMLVLTPVISPALLLSLTPLQIWLLVFCCLNTLLAYGSFAEALVHWHASKVSAVLALAPLFTIAGLKFTVWVNPDYAHTDHLNFLSVLAAVILVSGSVFVALVPLYMQRKIDRLAILP
jgi:drug/metabolite transporter (DMT)-like permease